MKTLRNQPSAYVKREPGEPIDQFTQRILKDPRLLPDQRITLEHDNHPGPWDDLVVGCWIEQAPITVLKE